MRIIRKLQSTFIVTACFVVACSYPLTAFAEGSSPTQQPSSSSTQPAPTTTAEPPAASSTQTQQPTPAPTNQATPSPTTPQKPSEPKKTYTYDAKTGRWNSDKWQYDASSGKYVPTPPAAPAAVVSPAQGTATSPLPSSTATIDAQKSSTVTTTEVANALNSLAKSGDSGVIKNNTGGNATTGDATAAATIVNNVNSSITNSSNKEAATFVSDVMGDVNGDIMLQPMLLKAMLEANVKKTQDTNVTNGTSVTNDINLAAQSGNATVAGNTRAGNATTGDAHTVADVVNIVNSMISANQSFVGTINIYGNLNGDILIAPDFIPQLLASNQANDSSTNANATQTVSSKDTQTIVNNVALAADSGKALVAGNTSAGDARSGKADTNLVIFNLSGHEIVAENSLLVFVNVLGKWVGVIVDAPTGATAAAIGNNVTKHTDVDASMTIDATNTTQLTNNLTLGSRSGDATVTKNTIAGDATTGNATASANIANISSSNIGLGGWFGVLFINVFGSWTGSFGIDTPAGNIIERQHTKSNDTLQRLNSRSNRTNKNGINKVLEFIPKRDAAQAQAMTVIDPGIKPTVVHPHAAVKAAFIKASPQQSMEESATRQAPTPQSRQVDIPLMIASLVMVGASLYGLRRFLF